MSLLTYDKGMAVLNLIFVQVRKVSSLATKITWLDLEEDLRVWVKTRIFKKSNLTGRIFNILQSPSGRKHQRQT